MLLAALGLLALLLVLSASARLARAATLDFVGASYTAVSQSACVGFSPRTQEK